MRHLLIIFFTVLLFSSCDPAATTNTNQTTVNTPAADTTSQNTSTSDTTQNNTTKTPDTTKKDKSGDIVGKWIHSNEQDTKLHEVYRKEGFNFPPSRGRESIVVRADGTFDYITIAPNDTREKNSGKWEVVLGKYKFTLDRDKDASFTATLQNNQFMKDK